MSLLPPIIEGAAMEESMEGGNKSNGPVNTNCLNCGTELTDKFCAHCGQKDLPKRQTMGELVENFIGSFYSFESKFFKTVKYLLFKPGFLPLEYTAGRRESYYHPARAYVFISFIFFLLFFSLPDDKKEESMTEEERPEMQDDLKDELDTLANDSAVDKSKAPFKEGKKRGVSVNIDHKYTTVRQYDSTQNSLPESKRDGWLERKLNIRVIEINNKYRDQGGDKTFESDFVKAFMDNFSKVLFYNLPIFALLLKLLYVRRDFYYSEHLVFSIYYYNFFYLAGSVSLLINLIPALSWVNVILVLWLMAYLLFAMKRMYLQTWKKTILKYSILTLLFLICLGVGLTINAILTLMWI